MATTAGLRTWQKWADAPIPGAQVHFGTRVEQFGLMTVRTKMRFRELAWRTGGEPEKLSQRRREVVKQRRNGQGSGFRSLEDQAAELNELVQRSFHGGKRANVTRIGDPNTGYLAKVEKNPDFPGFFPEFAVIHPDPAYLQEIPVELLGRKVDVGLVAIHLYGPMTILDGQTRLQGALRYAQATGSEWVLDQEVAICIVSGIPVEKAQQIFVTVNATPVPVGFDQLIDKDRMIRAYELTRYVIQNGNLRRDGQSIVGSGRGRVRKKAVYQFVTQALLGGRGETKNADYLLEGGDVGTQKEMLLEVLGKAELALGPDRWADTHQLLVGGYGLAVIGRIYHETTLGEADKPPISFQQALDRIRAIDWNVDNPTWLDTGLTAVSRSNPNRRVSKLTSFDMIRRAVDIILGPEWERHRRQQTAGGAK
jgi:hypothetical protein